MRVLFWSESYWPYVGGVEVGGRQLAGALRERGCEIMVVTAHRGLDLPDEDTFEDIPIRRFDFFAPFAHRDIDRLEQIHADLARLKRSFRPDVYHLNFFGANAIYHLQTLRSHVAPTLATLRGVLPDNLLRGTAIRKTLERADWVAACSAAVLEQTARHMPEIAERSSVVYNGLEAPAQPPTDLHFEPPRLLCVGRLAPEKGFDLAIRATAALIERFAALRLVIAGDGPCRVDLERLARELGVDHAVEFRGWVTPDAVPTLIDTATLVLMPSWTEGLPLTAIQAGQMARPTAGTRAGGLPEVIADGKTGLLVEPGDAAALAHAVAWMLERPAAARSMGASARRRIAHLFTLDRCADAYLALYRSLAERGAPVTTA